MYQSVTLLTKSINTKSKEKDTSSNTQKIQTGLFYLGNYIIDVDTCYVLIFIHIAICEIYYVLLTAAFDVLYVTLVEFCCGLFESLRYRLENAFDFENNNGGLILTQITSYSNIVYCIRRHTEAMQFIAIMESMYNIPFFVHVGFLVISLSIVEFQI
ncbi:uncharacterized protein LOC112638049 [Camponotus floridanus]|uniref:uncharacterized protein LOC112638049 n=1 Tax=Camponotus floridanus TaxID=104421 RepID=UPI000DC6BAEF|nr:uncharacterized protein LOC112638049 [Camponotus floridanus]